MSGKSSEPAPNPGLKGGPLAGLRVFDMTQVAAGPWASLLLGSLGATVLRIEPPGEKWSGDMSARILPTMNGLGTTWLTCNQFKQSVSLNFKDPEDVQLGYELAASCDLYIENMRKGVAERLGFSYEALQKLNPSIGYVSINGYGQEGPMSDQGATDPLIQAYSGWASLNGTASGEMHRSYAHLDLTSGTYAAYAALLLLLRRKRTGQGGRLNIAMFRAALANQTTKLAEFFAAGSQARPSGSAATRTAPDQAFRCQDGRYLAVSCETNAQWQALCDTLHLSGLGATYPTTSDRLAARDKISQIVTDVLLTKPSRWWQLRLTKAGVPNSLFLSFDELLGHPQVQANSYLVQNQTAFGPLWVGQTPFRYRGRTLPQSRSTSPGADTEAVLSSPAYRTAATGRVT
ncbi:MAG TPA: CaiB/BaiF CoA-transferase family protein [Dehalococcoidia bacterium]|nr:CaiB/BaiF CoA-transferase family protein [Dehalococcoidia bacterium]